MFRPICQSGQFANLRLAVQFANGTTNLKIISEVSVNLVLNVDIV